MILTLVATDDDGPRCPNCWKPRPDFAHGVFEAVAMTLAEPLRRAFSAHLEEHRCRGCPEAWRLFEMLPEDDQVLLA